MYRAEVLGKLPVMQHFLFGSILPYDGPLLPLTTHAEGEGPADDAHWGHAHAHKALGELGGAAGQREVGWGDCCGIPVPSAFGAAAAEKKRAESATGPGGLRLGGPNVRPVPFD